MELSIFFLIFSIPIATCDFSVPAEWINAKSPLSLPIYQKVLSKFPQPSVPARQGRITNGKTAKLGQIPHQVLLYISPDASLNTYLCGATIISSKWILTAAHYVYEMTNGTAYAGVIDRVMGRPTWAGSFNSTKFIVHQGYDPLMTSNDVALIDAGNVTFGPYVQPISLPTAELSLLRRLAEISGWGLTKDGGGSAQELQYTQGPIVSNSICAKYYGSENVEDSNVCLDTKTRRSACSGDSGGPMTTIVTGRKILVGLVSFGSIFGCELGFPAVFSKVSSHLDWIKANTGI